MTQSTAHNVAILLILPLLASGAFAVGHCLGYESLGQQLAICTLLLYMVIHFVVRCTQKVERNVSLFNHWMDSTCTLICFIISALVTLFMYMWICIIGSKVAMISTAGYIAVALIFLSLSSTMLYVREANTHPHDHVWLGIIAVFVFAGGVLACVILLVMDGHYIVACINGAAALVAVIFAWIWTDTWSCKEQKRVSAREMDPMVSRADRFNHIHYIVDNNDRSAHHHLHLHQSIHNKSGVVLV
jgi:hypothetical protein